MPSEETARIVAELASRGYNADREAVTLLARAPDRDRAITRAVETAPDDALVLSAAAVRAALDDTPDPATDPPVSGGDHDPESGGTERASPVETKGSTGGREADDPTAGQNAVTDRPDAGTADTAPGEPTADSGVSGDRELSMADVSGDIQSTGTGEYGDFVSVFRDRYERLADLLAGRVNHRPAGAVADLSNGSEVALIGMVADAHSTAGGHWRFVLEDTSGSAALVSDVHVGSQEFRADAWGRFADWLHTDAASDVEYLLVAGDMVEGVGVYPGQDEELDIVDIYDQYERFSEHLKNVPGDMEVVMIPGNHDAVRLAEPQPAFDEELRGIMSAHDATISANPSTVTVEGVSVLMYHGVSLDELIAELPAASYDRPAETMTYLLEKRHLAPQYGGQVRVAPEESDHLVIDEVPDIFHAGHVHKFGYTDHRGVLTVNSACWQSQTDFQASVNLDPDVAYAPIVDLQTLDLSYAQFV